MLIRCKPPRSDLNGWPSVLHTDALTNLSYWGMVFTRLLLENNENDRTRTYNLQLRKLTRYPVALRSLGGKQWTRTTNLHFGSIRLANDAYPLIGLLSIDEQL